MSRVRFTTANVIGGALWAAAVAILGFAAGASYRTLEQRLGLGGEALTLVVVLLLVVWVVRARRAGVKGRSAGPG